MKTLPLPTSVLAPSDLQGLSNEEAALRLKTEDSLDLMNNFDLLNK